MLWCLALCPLVGAVAVRTLGEAIEYAVSARPSECATFGMHQADLSGLLVGCRGGLCQVFNEGRTEWGGRLTSPVGSA